MSSATGLPFFGFNYGEDTKLSVTVKAVHFNVYTVPQQGRALVWFTKRVTDNQKGGNSSHCSQ